MKQQNKNLIKYLIPAVIGQVCFFLFTIVDGIFVGNGVGENALGAINICMPFVMTVNALYMLITVGGVTIYAVRTGRNDCEGANQAFMHSLVLMLVLGALLTAIGTTLSEQLGYLFGANETYIGYVSDYLVWYSAFILPASLSMLLQFFVRNDGSPLLVMIATIVSSCLNIFLDWLFVFPLQKGIAGAAIATGISQTTCLLIILFHFFLKKGSLKAKKFSLSGKLFGKIFLRGTPETIAQFAIPVATFCMNKVLLSYLGENAINAFSVISYVASFAMAIFLGVSEGAQPLFGQAYGEKNEADLKHYFIVSAIFDFIGSTLVYVILLFIGKAVSGMFGADGTTADLVVKVMPQFGSTLVYVILLFIGKAVSGMFGADGTTADLVVKVMPQYGWGFILMSLNTIISAYMYSTKRTSWAVVFNLLRSFLFTTLITLALPAICGADVIWFTFGIYETLSFILAVILLKASEKNGIRFK